MSTQTQDGAAASPKDKTLLVLLENNHTRKLTVDIVHSLGLCRHVVAKSAEEALSLVAKTTIDAVLVGLAHDAQRLFLSTLRGHPDARIRQIPVIVMRENVRRADVEEARDNGANDFLSPPLSAKLVQQKLENVWLRPRAFLDGDTFVGPDRRRTGRHDSFASGGRRAEDKKAIE